MARFEVALAEAVALDLDAEPGSLRSRMVAAAATAALSALSSYYKDDEDRASPLGDDPMTVIDEALTFLRGGVAALHRADAAK